MATSQRVDTLHVPGARLHYEIRGSGPVLLMIPAGPLDADVFADVADRLADRYTVVTYDPRGNSRSELEGEPENWRAESHADDASRLLLAVSSEPAFVFGTSSGALVGLALATRHPEQVHTLVAHEPPATELLPDRDKHRADGAEIYQIYIREGVGPALAKFMADAEFDADAEMPPMSEYMAKNLDLFFGYGMRSDSDYMPDIEALRRVPSRVIFAVGEASRGQLAYMTSLVLAEQLGVNVVDFPGDHGGFVAHAADFASKLDEVLRSS